MLITENQFVHTWHNTLLRSSEKRDISKSEQDSAYLASLAKDKADDETREAIEQDLMQRQRKESLWQAQSLGVPNEPNPPCITVQVHHPTMGRGCSSSDTMMAVYGWVGSQTTEPEYFVLCSNCQVLVSYNITYWDWQGDPLHGWVRDSSLYLWWGCRHVELRGFGQLVNCSATTEEHVWRWNALMKCFKRNSWTEILPVERTMIMILLPCKYECMCLYLSRRQLG